LRYHEWFKARCSKREDVTHLQVLQPYRFILPNGGRNGTVPVLSMNLSNIARRQSNTAPNMAGSLDAELRTGVSSTCAICVLFIRLQNASSIKLH
jgi:hypothetical protein